SPANDANFLAITNVVSFHVIDDTNTPLNNIVLTLNGVRYTNGHPNVTITGGNTDRLFKLTNLTANVNYVGSIQATDNVGLVAAPVTIRFDTFSPTNLVVESEEYNFDSG